MAARAPSQYDIDKTNIERGLQQDTARLFYFEKQLHTVPSRSGSSKQKLETDPNLSLGTYFALTEPENEHTCIAVHSLIDRVDGEKVRKLTVWAVLATKHHIFRDQEIHSCAEGHKRLELHLSIDGATEFLLSTKGTHNLLPTVDSGRFIQQPLPFIFAVFDETL